MRDSTEKVGCVAASRGTLAAWALGTVAVLAAGAGGCAHGPRFGEVVPSDFGAKPGAPFADFVAAGGRLTGEDLAGLKRDGVITDYRRKGPEYLALDVPEGGRFRRFELFYSPDGARLLGVWGEASAEVGHLYGKKQAGSLAVVEDEPAERIAAPFGVVRKTDVPGVFATHWPDWKPGVLWVLDVEQFWPLCGDSAPFEASEADMVAAGEADRHEEVIRLGSLMSKTRADDTVYRIRTAQQVYERQVGALKARLAAAGGLLEAFAVLQEVALYADVLSRAGGAMTTFPGDAMGRAGVARLEEVTKEVEARAAPFTLAAWGGVEEVLGVVAASAREGAWGSSTHDHLLDGIKEKSAAQRTALYGSWSPRVFAPPGIARPRTWRPSRLLAGEGTGIDDKEASRRFGRGDVAYPAADTAEAADVAVVVGEAKADLKKESRRVSYTESYDTQNTTRDSAGASAWVDRYNAIISKYDRLLAELRGQGAGEGGGGPFGNARSTGVATAKDTRNADGSVTRRYEQEGIDLGDFREDARATAKAMEHESELDDLKRERERELDALGPRPSSALRTETQTTTVEREAVQLRWRGKVTRKVTLRVGKRKERFTQTQAVDTGEHRIGLKENSDWRDSQTAKAVEAMNEELRTRLEAAAEGWVREQAGAYPGKLAAEGKAEDAAVARWMLGLPADDAALPDWLRARVRGELPSFETRFEKMKKLDPRAVVPEARILQLRGH